MGSIEAFPRKRGAATLADVVRIAPLRGGGMPRVRAAKLEDYAGLRALQRRVQPEIACCSVKQFESQRVAFPEGQLVAECDGEIVGYGSSLVVNWDAPAPTWQAVTGDGFFSTHDPEGTTLYAAHTCVDLARHGHGAGRALHQARRRLCRRFNLRRIIGATSLSGYEAASREMAVEEYARRVLLGDLDDALLRHHLAQGYQYCGVAADYLPAQTPAAAHAALLVWLNPMYTPPGPPAFETERPRKYA